MMDDLVEQFRPSNAKFVEDYLNARIIVDTAASHAAKPTEPTPKPVIPAPPK